MGYIWVLLLVLNSILGAYAAKLSNQKVAYGSLMVFTMSLLGVFLWVWVTRISKNIMFDSLLYDIILVITFTGTFVVLKCGSSFSTLNWIGVGLTVIGLIIMKLPK